ncbi:MAG: ABC transporter [Gammaproteobacteria bacterium CG22_combo_CG10-13_8_21_14_all_40_8]|nr:MAG: ABC transporter [Gammaproteobacteria bacterium CG22_combo_CG10-13_8_21_14_all_40_8]
MKESIFRLFMGILVLATLAGCASTKYSDPKDPYEGFNRSLYKFNKGVDRAVLKPLAKGYVAVTPKPVQKGVSNFFGNLNDIVTTVNDVLQAKGKQAGSDGLRFVVNSTFGLAGLFDVASIWGLEKHDEDFGQTFGYWGMGSGSYLMLPFFGPSTTRDAPGIVGEHFLNPFTYANDANIRYGSLGIHLVEKRASFLEFESQLKEAIDEYTFIKNAYLQNREYKVYDGHPPQDDTWLLDEDCEALDACDDVEVK